MLGVVRLGLNANYDRLEDLANHHLLLRQILSVNETPRAEEAVVFNHQTLRDNVALVDETLLATINAKVAAAGREVFAKKRGRASRAAGAQGGQLRAGDRRALSDGSESAL